MPNAGKANKKRVFSPWQAGPQECKFMAKSNSMKHLFFCALLSPYLMAGMANAQVSDSTLQKITAANTATIVKAIEKVAAFKDSGNTKPLPTPSIALQGGMVRLLTFLPVIFFLIILLMVTGKLKKEGAKLSWFLLDKEFVAQLGRQNAQVETARLTAMAKATTPEQRADIARLSPAANTDPTADAEEPAPPDTGKESVSRLVALITGLVTLGIASCLSSFYIYKSFTGHADIDLGNLATVLYGLGLGLVPYGFSKVAGALKG